MGRPRPTGPHLPGVAEVGAPALVAAVGRPGRFRNGAAFRRHTGLTPRAAETGESDRKGQPMSKAGPSLLRTTLFRAADNARRQDPQLAAIYHTQMAERGANHTKACCVVAGHLAERAWAVLNRGMPHVICDTNGEPVTADQAKTIIAERYTIAPDVRARRRSRKHPKNKSKPTPKPQPTQEPAQGPAQERQRGRPLSKPTHEGMTHRTRAASTHEATFPTADPTAPPPRHPHAPSTTPAPAKAPTPAT